MELISSFINTLLHYRVDYNSVTSEYFKHWRSEFGNTCGLIYILIFVPICLYTHIAVANRFRKKHPNEEVIYVIKNSVSFLFFIMYTLGYFFGSFVAPFICFENIQGIKLPNNWNIWVWIPAYAISMLAILIGYSTTYVISDRRIEAMSAYRICDKIIKKHCLFFKDMSNVSLKIYHHFLSELDITLKNGEHFYIARALVNYKKAKKIIEGNISKWR